MKRTGIKPRRAVLAPDTREQRLAARAIDVNHAEGRATQ